MTVADGLGGEVEVPASIFDHPIRHPAIPRLGQHTDEVLAQLDAGDVWEHGP